MPKLPKISIITPTLNQGNSIERTIKSVIDQDYPNMEYIVVDGGSSDRTIDILKKYNNKLQWISEKDKGQSDAINKGIKLATGDIIAYLNSDDMYEKNALRKVADFFIAHPSVMWLTGRCRIIDEYDREIRKAVSGYKNFFLSHYNYNILLITNFISQPATFLRRKAIEEIGHFDINHHLVMDYDYWLRIGRRYIPGIINETLAMFRVYRGSKTSTIFYQSFKQEMEVSRKYSHSNIIRALHYCNYVGICSVYTLLDIISQIKHRI